MASAGPNGAWLNWTPRTAAGANGFSPSTHRKTLSSLLSPRHTRFLAIAGTVLLTFLLYSLFAHTHRPAHYSQYPYTHGDPFSTDPNTDNEARGGGQTHVIFNHHEPIQINSPSIAHVDLNSILSTSAAAQRHERVLILTPLRDAVRYLPKYFELLEKLSYPHWLTDLAFLISDTTDETLAHLSLALDRIQGHANPAIPFASVTIIQKDFGLKTSQNVEDRHAFQYQAPRRMAMARARNYLLSAALNARHSWVYWRDVDIVEAPASIIEDLISHDRDVIVPNVWFHRLDDEGKDVEGRFDYNSWVDTAKTRKMLSKLETEVVVVEGYPSHFDTGRIYMAKMGDWRDDPRKEIKLDGIGGVSIMVKADVHRSGTAISLSTPSASFSICLIGLEAN
jgi:Anp1